MGSDHVLRTRVDHRKRTRRRMTNTATNDDTRIGGAHTLAIVCLVAVVAGSMFSAIRLPTAAATPLLRANQIPPPPPTTALSSFVLLSSEPPTIISNGGFEPNPPILYVDRLTNGMSSHS